jgi:hypothetical protein
MQAEIRRALTPPKGKITLENNMKNKTIAIGIISIALITLLMLTGCEQPSDGSSSGGGGLYAELKDPDRIKVYTGSQIAATNITDKTGFSVTVNGASQSISSLLLSLPGYENVEIFLVSNVPGSGDIKVSYDGTGAFAGKLSPFTNLAVSR